ncbi:MAG: SLC13 family permease [Alphaproteobacteria bacterium]|nr:SLC13 family permease [Alphaproteobacteria bacterium]MBT7941785.1 SLC13 family permease [Alphaproteobacteria bacterium]
MWAVFALIVTGLFFYISERLSMEVISIGIICALLVFFHVFPVPDADGNSLLTSKRILEGFANPALITVLALLVLGQGMIRTGILERGAGWFLEWSQGHVSAGIAIFVTLVIVGIISAFLNNTPVVVIFIPIVQVLAARFGHSVSKIMIPLSFIAILGGMTTLIGSSTNLLVNSALIEMDMTPFGFFDFTIPGLVLALTGLLYVVFIAPHLLPDRAGMADNMMAGDHKQFVAQITVSAQSGLVGKDAPGGHFPSLPEKTLRMVQRGEKAILPPFESYVARPGDVLVVAATRKALGEFLGNDPGLLYPDLEEGLDVPGEVTSAGRWQEGGQALAEVMVAPASRMINLTLPQIGFRYKTHCIVLGIQRRSRMVRQRITEVRLQAGDVLLVQGQPDDITRLRRNRDVVLAEGTAEELPVLEHAKRSSLIFFGVVVLAATGLVPIVAAAMTGAIAMVATGVLNVRQASRAIDSKIVTAIAAAIAMSVALQDTGGAALLAHGLVASLSGATPGMVLSVFFLIAAVMTNIISNNAIAVLFTPIGVGLALELGVAPHVFAVAVVLAANCSFASPLGYQTNLLVMGPGHYRFADFARAGLPLIVLMWLAFSLFAPWYYGL